MDYPHCNIILLYYNIWPATNFKYYVDWIQICKTHHEARGPPHPLNLQSLIQAPHTIPVNQLFRRLAKNWSLRSKPLRGGKKEKEGRGNRWCSKLNNNLQCTASLTCWRHVGQTFPGPQQSLFTDITGCAIILSVWILFHGYAAPAALTIFSTLLLKKATVFSQNLLLRLLSTLCRPDNANHAV